MVNINMLLSRTPRIITDPRAKPSFLFGPRPESCTQINLIF